MIFKLSAFFFEFLMATPYKDLTKDESLWRMVIIAFLHFLVGLFIPATENLRHIILVSAGMITGFTFYLLRFRKMLKDSMLTKNRSMLWTISIVCLPMIGNTLYVIIDMMSTAPQSVISTTK